MTASAGPALKRLHHEFGERVAFVTLYVREAHPGERYPQPETIERKIRHARDYRDRDGIPWPVAVDDVDGSLHRALDPKPSSVYIMDRDGTVALRALWSNDERVLREGLELVTGTGDGAPRQRVNRIVPMTRGLGRQYEILELAGRQAKRDVLREAPPMMLMARLAHALRPLPPLARGAVAQLLMLAVPLAGALMLGRRMHSRSTGEARFAWHR